MHSQAASPIILIDNDINQKPKAQLMDYWKTIYIYIPIYVHEYIYFLKIQKSAKQPDTYAHASSRSTGRRRIREPSDSNDEVAAAAAISLLAAS